VETKIPRSFWHMEKELDFRFQTPQIRATMAARKKKINQAMDAAAQILAKAGFPEDAVHIRVHIKNQSIVQDIVEESHQGYDALVIGRHGHSRLKDFLMDTLPMKLLGKVKNIPLIVVGNTPDHKKILVAFDGTREIIRAVKCVSSLISTRDCRLLLCHSQHEKSMFNEEEEDPLDQAPAGMFDMPMSYFLEAGFSSDQVSFEIISGGKNPTHGILDKARYENYGTIVVGRRGLTPLKGLMFGRVGNRIFRKAENHVVWIVQ